MAEHRSYYRNAVLIGTTLYIVILSLENPICWKLDLNGENPNWVNDFVKVCNSYRPVKYPATLSILNKIYIHGGIDLLTGQPTNILYEFDVSNMQLLVLIQKGTVPYPCSMHTLSALDYNRLAIYGGQCIANGIPYNTKCFAIYDLTSKFWTIYNEMSNMPYARALHCAVQASDRLYVYGGQHIDSEGITRVHDDECVWAYDIQHHKWQKYLSPTRESNTFPFGFPINWLSTTGWKQSPGRCSGATMINLNGRIAIIGGLVLASH
ncbi:5777_t:CDS:2 [Paraglomus brasilianum]|uniref:5777_t:CDS:1 n=1 Tax=Paraglomus brasilianum TaxID=144538 RepID=A0A9N9CVG9_9GLOM|nr:5777_t:CDS:2 [Paraglomus brasilianum]